MSAGACPTGCGRSTKPGHLMCGTCWAQVPKYLQRDVYRTWRRAEPIGRTQADVDAYRQAREAAIASI